MAGSLIYSNARVKCLENSILSQEKINRLATSESLVEAVKILSECGYGGIAVSNPYNYEELLFSESSKISAFLRETMVAKSGLESFLILLDYHNAKASLKAKYTDSNNLKAMLMPSGTISAEVITEAVYSDNYNKLPNFMVVALNNIDNANLAGQLGGKLIDVELDKAMYKHIVSILSHSKKSNLHKYFVANIDFLNLATFIRCRRLELDLAYFKAQCLTGGSVEPTELERLYLQPLDNLASKFGHTEYKNIVSVATELAKSNKNLTEFEVETDNYMLDLFKSNRNDVFTIAPITGFYVAKLIEIKVVRMILVCLKNNVDKNLIKQRLRKVYA